MWQALKEIAARECCSIHDICTLISSRKKDDMTLTASIRIFLMLYFKSAATEEGHIRAGHGGFHKMLQRANRGNTVANDDAEEVQQNQKTAFTSAASTMVAE